MKKLLLLLIIIIVVLVVVFSREQKGADIAQYFGKTETEIRTMLGQPTESWRYEDELRALRGQAWMDEQSQRAGAAIKKEANLSYLLDQASFPKPFREMKFRFSGAGLCCQIHGITQGYKTPDTLLKAIGLGGMTIESSVPDQLGFNYTMPPFDMVQVGRLSSLKKKYESFNVLNREAGYPAKWLQPATPQDIAASSFKTAITVDGGAGDWSNIPVLITGPQTGAASPDLKSLRVAIDDSYIYFLFEVVGWAEPFKTTNTRFGPASFHGAWGDIFLDVDNKWETGDRIGDLGEIFFPRYLCGAEYNIELRAGFVGEPQANYSLKCRAVRQDKEGFTREMWVDVAADGKNVAHNGAFMEFAVPKSLLGIEKGNRVTLTFDASSGLRLPIVVREVILPIAVGS